MGPGFQADVTISNDWVCLFHFDFFFGAGLCLKSYINYYIPTQRRRGCREGRDAASE